MSSIIQWNCKGLRARHEEVRLLMNKIQQEVMLENIEYEIEIEYATIPPGQISKGGTAITIR